MVFNTFAVLSEGSGTTGTPSLLPTLLMIGGLILVFYFFMIRPQKKQENEVRNMRDNLVVGDEITTIGGIIGKIVSIKEETCMIETGKDKVRMRILKSAVRCVDVPNEAAREALAAQRAAEAEKEAAERAAKQEEARQARLNGIKNGKKGKGAKAEPKAEVNPAEEAAEIPEIEVPEVETPEE